MIRISYGVGIAAGVVAVIALIWLCWPSGEAPSGDQPVGSPGREAPVSVALRGAKHATPASEPTTQGTFAVLGRVVDEENAPVVGVPVGLRRIGARPWDYRDSSTWTPERKAARGAPPFDAIDAPWGDLDFEPDMEVLSGERGSFTFEQLDSGTYVLQALPQPPLVSDRHKLRLSAFSEEKEVVLRVTAGVALRGRVVDRNGAGIAAVVTGTLVPTAGQERRSPPPASSAEGDGAFALRGLVAGRWRLQVVVPGKRRLSSIPVDVPYDGVFTVVVDDGTGAVTGQVTAAAGGAVAGADVLVTVRAAGPAKDVDIRGATNTDGRFHLESMPEGAVHRVSVRHPHFLLYDARPPEATWSGATVTAGTTTTIDVALCTGTHLSGRVLEQETGRPLAGVEVFLLERQSHNRVTLPFRVLTDEDGTYHIDDVPPGRRVLMARCPTHYLPQASAPSAAPIRSEEDGAPVFVSPDPPEGLLVVTEEGDGKIERDLLMAPGLEIRGRVLGPDDQTVRDAGILMRNQALSRTLRSWGVSWPAWNHPLATSGHDGAFSIRNLPPLDACVLYARKAPFLPVDSGPISLSAGAPTSVLTLHLAAGAILEGRLADASGRGVQGTIDCSVQGGSRGLGVRVQTAADGSFRLEGVPIGQVVITARARGQGSFRTQLTPPLEPGEVRADLDLRFPERVRVSGVVVNEEGAPHAQLGLSIRGLDQNGESVNVRTDAEGRFECDHAPKGRVRFATFRTVAGRFQAIEIGDVVETPVDGLRLVLPSMKVTVLEGRILDAEGQPVPLCRVRIRSLASEESDRVRTPMYALSDPDGVNHGVFRREVEGSPPFEIAVSAPRDEHGTPLNLRPVKVEVTGAETEPIEIRLEPGREVTGSVVDEQGTGVEGVTLHCGTVLARSRPDGGFVLGGLDEGPLRILVEPPPAYPEPHPVEIASDVSSVVVHLIRGTCVAGRVRMATGEVPPGVVALDVRVPATDYGPSATRYVEAQSGDFRVQGILPGTTVSLIANIRAPSGETWPPIHREVAAGTEDIELVVSQGAILTGQIVDAEGRPVPRAQLLLQLESAGQYRFGGAAICGPDGRFRLNGLEPGDHTVLVLTYDGSRALCIRRLQVPASDVQIAVRDRKPMIGRVTGDGALGGFKVVAYMPGLERTRLGPAAETAVDGTFQLTACDAPELLLRVSKKDDDRYARSASIGPSATSVSLALAHGETLAGTILRPDGTAPDRAWVAASNPGWHAVTYADANGRFELRGLPSGTYRVVAMMTHGSIGEVEVPTGTTDLQFRAP